MNLRSADAGKIVLAGGSGLIGRALATWFGARGWEVVVLSRRAENETAQAAKKNNAPRVVHWDGEHLGVWAGELEGATALVNLAGRSVNCRYNAHNRQEMMDSRILSTRVLGEAVRACIAPPKVWLQSSTATIYKHTYSAGNAEKTGVIGATPEANDAYSIEVATAWEREFDTLHLSATRKVTLRTAIVLAPDPGGAYAIMRRLVRFGLGGSMGDGRQYFSWLHRDDFNRAVEWLIANENAIGVYNLAAPNPITNREFMAIFRRVCGRRIGLPAASWMLEIGAFFLRTETELMLKSRRVVPGRLLAEGFTFNYPTVETALAELEAESRAKPAP